MDLLNALQFLNLNQVPQDWVDAVWDLEFTERKPIEDIIEDKLRAGGEKSFRSLYYSLLDHAAEQQQSAGRDGASQGVWVILGENGVSLKSLVAVLSHFVLAVRAKGASVQQRVCGLYAASVYLLLLGIPVINGSKPNLASPSMAPPLPARHVRRIANPSCVHQLI
ncbi:hypothetical protein XENORESO_005906 [Xenotaenia resolanae]|uniref:Uncharacterized protein n=1 Tax=Xenotaenia resolanae TaxID=208358 RepID=A0ABV0X393_9TELE